jgi:hypothetical protein
MVDKLSRSQSRGKPVESRKWRARSMATLWQFKQAALREWTWAFIDEHGVTVKHSAGCFALLIDAMSDAKCNGFHELDCHQIEHAVDIPEHIRESVKG